jgi:hypothetical protein
VGNKPAPESQEESVTATKERLAQALHAAGLFEMEKAARTGRYDDFEGDSATPIVDLVNDLKAAGQHDLAKRAMNGEWDGTKKEAEAWFHREGKDLPR